MKKQHFHFKWWPSKEECAYCNDEQLAQLKAREKAYSCFNIHPPHEGRCTKLCQCQDGWMHRCLCWGHE